MFERKRYQFGYVRRKERKAGPHVWVWSIEMVVVLIR
jgi:hypothetical protein